MKATKRFVKSRVLFNPVNKPGYVKVGPDDHFGQAYHPGEPFGIQGIFLLGGKREGHKKNNYS
jgi:hypothetical protein